MTTLPRAAPDWVWLPDEAVTEGTPPEIVGRLLDHAAQLGASDLFLSSEDGYWTAGVRHLGVVRPVCRLPADLGRHCAAHLRAEAGMDVAEHRRPQEGRWAHFARTGHRLDLRISTLPSLHGESISIRLLDRETGLVRLDRIGLPPADRERLEDLLALPGGLVLITGPTGSGKTTTLRACLQYLNDGRRQIHTIEDPIEYTIPGVHQSQVNPKSGVNFPDLLRAIIRQGPDVIAVGEIRDAEAARTAIAAGNSGHLILATLHTPRAAGCVSSMLAFGVHPRFLAATLIGAVSQRLIRTICPDCPPQAGRGDHPGPRGGCGRCHDTGYAGRTGVFEVLAVTPAVRELVDAQTSAQAIEAQALRDGMTSLARPAEDLVARGVTDRAEARRRIPPEDFQAPRPGCDRAVGTSTVGVSAVGEEP